MNQIDKVLPTPQQVDELVNNMTAIEGTAEKYMEEMHHEKEIGDMLIRLIPRLKDIWNHFGELNQRDKFMEEVKEYIESGEKLEISDIIVLALQIFIHDKEVRDGVFFKTDRTENRIKEEYYEVEK